MPECPQFQEVGTDPQDLNDCLDSCLATGIGGRIVKEGLEIVKVCQDPNSLGIVYMEFVIAGVFDYIPEFIIEYKDSSGEFVSRDVSPNLIFNYKNAAESVKTLPIQTRCGSVNKLIAWDVASLIPIWGSLSSVRCKFTLYGDFIKHSFDQELLLKLGELFESNDPTQTVELIKGPTPIPYALYFDESTGQLKLQYAGLGGLPCFCDIDCANLSEDNQELVLCDDEIQEVTIDINSIVGDPTKISLVFRDVIGNTTNISSQILVNVTPHSPGAIYQVDPIHIQILPYYATSSNIRLDKTKTAFQIWRYKNNKDNTVLIRDWTDKNWTTIFDTDVSAGNVYGYAIKFRGEFGETSDLSMWSEVDLSRI